MQFLDPRDRDAAAARPIVDAVNIPLAELDQRVYELPPRHHSVIVAAAAPLCARTIAWLRGHGRVGAPAGAFHTRAPGEPAAPGRLWRVNAFLERVVDRIAPGDALDAACGAGREAVFLADRGWTVLGVDVLPDALDKAERLAAVYAGWVTAPRWQQVDLERDPPDWRERFDLIVCLRYLHRPLLERFGQWLRPGGRLVLETFTTLHRARHGRPRRDAFVLRPGELRAGTPGLRVIEYEEGWQDEAHTARLLAERPRR